MRGDTWPIRVDFATKREVCDGAASTSAPTKITSATASFNSTHLNQDITLAGAGEGGVKYEGQIAAIDSATQVTVCPKISETVTAEELTFGQAINITGDLLFFTLKTSPDDLDAAAVLQHSVTAPANAESTAGIGRIPVPIAKTALVTPATYSFDVQRVTPGNPPTLVETPQYGTIEVLPDITRSTA